MALRQLLRNRHAPYGWTPVVFACALLLAIAGAVTAFAFIDEPAETRRLTYALLATGVALLALLGPKHGRRDWIGFALALATAAVFWAYYFELVPFPLIAGAG